MKSSGRFWFVIGAAAGGILCNSGCKEPPNSTAQVFEPSAKLLSLVPVAQQQIHSTNLSDRIAALNQLVVIQGNECVRGYELRFELPPSDYVGVARAVFSGGLGGRKHSEEAVGILGKLNFVATKLNLRELGQEFLPFLESSNTTVQYVALEAIGSLKPNGAAQPVAKLLPQPEWPIGRKTVETLVALRAKEAIPPLASRLKSPERNERWAAIMSLDAVGDTAAAPYLATALNDLDECNRYWIRQTLGKLKAVRELRAALQNPRSPAEEAHALVWLALADDKEALTNVARYLLEGGRISAATMRDVLLTSGYIDSKTLPETLAKTQSHQVWRLLATWMQQGRSPSGKKIDDGVLRETALFMSGFGSREAIPFLLEMVKPRNRELWHTRAAGGYSTLYVAADALGKFRAKDAVPDLLTILTNQAPGTILTADLVEIALSRIADEAAVTALLEWCRDPRRLMRSQILMNLNVTVDEHLSQRIENTSVRGLYQAPINVTAASVTAQSGLPIVLHYEPADGRSWPWANTSVQTISVRYALERILDALKLTRTEYTVVLRKGEAHIVTVEDGIAELAKVLRQP